MTKLAPEWVRTSDPVIRSPAHYRWTMAPAWECEERRARWDMEQALCDLLARLGNQAAEANAERLVGLTSLCHSNGHIETMPASDRSAIGAGANAERHQATRATAAREVPRTNNQDSNQEYYSVRWDNRFRS